MFATPPLIQRWREGRLGEVEREFAEQVIERWRARLSEVSWYMRCLNEYLARRANAEDRCTGRFWEGRFRSQALLDEAGLLTAMAYVDLNPVRAGVAATPEDSQFTSICAHIRQMRAPDASANPQREAVPELLGFSDSQAPRAPAIPMGFRDYLQLVDWSGRLVRGGSRGAIDHRTPPILQRLNIDPHAWQHAMRIKGNLFGRALGRLDRLRLHAQALGQSRVKGLMQAERLFRTS